MSLVTAASFAANFLLPGAWIAFSPLTVRFDGWVRLLFAVILSIPVAGAEYQLLRAAGLASDSAVALLPLLNLPALALIWRARQGFARPGVAGGIATAAAIAIPVLFLAVVFAIYEEKSFWGHTWLHTDMIYALRQNSFAPEERQLAGLVATYPWFGHLFLLIQSTALDQSPLQSFTAINLILAAAYGGFAVATVAAVGGGPVARLAAPFLFSFALNPVGVTATRIAAELGRSVERWAYLAGDPRYDFLLIKHLRLNLNQIALTFLAAMLLLIVQRRQPGREGRKQAVLLALMVLVVTLHYPLYMPVAVVFVLAWAMADLLLGQPRDLAASALTGGLALIAAGLGAWAVLLPLGPRAVEVGIGPAGPGLIWRHAIMLGFACSLPALAAFWLVRRHRGERRVSDAALLLAAAGCGLLAVLTHIPNKENEYKFVLAAGLALMPFLARAVDEGFRLWRRGTAVAAAAALAALSLYAAIDSVTRRDMRDGDDPPLVYAGLFQSVEPSDPAAAAIAAIRHDTPPDAVLLADDTQLELSVLTLRAQYVPYDPDRIHPGMTFRNDYLLENVKGYDAGIVDARRAELMALFDGPDDASRAKALAAIGALGRPLVLMVAEGRHDGLGPWLLRTGKGGEVHRDAAYAVWLVPNPD